MSLKERAKVMGGSVHARSKIVDRVMMNVRRKGRVCHARIQARHSTFTLDVPGAGLTPIPPPQPNIPPSTTPFYNSTNLNSFCPKTFEKTEKVWSRVT